MNLKDAILYVAKGEPIEAVVIGEHDNERWDDEKPRSPSELINRVISWTVAEKILDYEYDNGYGGADCHPLYVWTPTRILFVHEYDGATGVNWVPRNPTDLAPTFGGQ